MPGPHDGLLSLRDPDNSLSGPPSESTENTTTLEDLSVLARLREGWLTLSTAASALGVDVDEVQRMLRNRHLTHTCDVARPIYRHELASVIAGRG